MNHMQSFLNCPSTSKKNDLDEVHDFRDYFPHETLPSVLLHSGKTANVTKATNAHETIVPCQLKSLHV